MAAPSDELPRECVCVCACVRGGSSQILGQESGVVKLAAQNRAGGGQLIRASGRGRFGGGSSGRPRIPAPAAGLAAAGDRRGSMGPHSGLGGQRAPPASRAPAPAPGPGPHGCPSHKARAKPPAGPGHHHVPRCAPGERGRPLWARCSSRSRSHVCALCSAAGCSEGPSPGWHKSQRCTDRRLRMAKNSLRSGCSSPADSRRPRRGAAHPRACPPCLLRLSPPPSPSPASPRGAAAFLTAPAAPRSSPGSRCYAPPGRPPPGICGPSSCSQRGPRAPPAPPMSPPSRR